MLLRFMAAILLLLSASCAIASANVSDELSPVIVTANRLAQSADDSLFPVTVITHLDIEQSQTQSLEDLLRGQVGIDISNNGGQGKTTSVFLRGTNSDHVLVLMDGTKIGSATTGTAALQDIPVALIDHIEIVRGPLSSLYGSEAIGGVIQIFTRKGQGPASSAVSVGGGSYSTKQGDMALSGSIGQGSWYSLGVSGFDTQGFNACQGSLTAGCYTIEPDKDGYRNISARLRLGKRFASGTEMEVNALRTTGDTQYDGMSSNESKTAQDVVGASSNMNILPAWFARFQLGQSRDNSDNYLNGVYQSRFNTRRDSASWQNNFSLDTQETLTAGIDWRNDQIDSTTVYTVTSRNNTGVYAEYLSKFGAQNLQLSLRQDHNQQFGSATTGNAAWGYRVSPHMRINIAYGTAFKAPTFNELYYPGFGNANLHPERSRSLDIGLASHTRTQQWSIHAYETRVTDLIGYDASYTPVNIDAARIRGVEAVVDQRFGLWTIHANLSLLRPINEAAGANNSKLLSRRAEQLFSLSADRKQGAWSIGASLRGEGHRYDDLANTQVLGGYATLDLRSEYRFDNTWRLQGHIENVFDKTYQTAYLYNQPGRGVYLMLRYQS